MRQRIRGAARLCSGSAPESSVCGTLEGTDHAQGGGGFEAEWPHETADEAPSSVGDLARITQHIVQLFDVFGHRRSHGHEAASTSGEVTEMQRLLLTMSECRVTNGQDGAVEDSRLDHGGRVDSYDGRTGEQRLAKRLDLVVGQGNA